MVQVSFPPHTLGYPTTNLFIRLRPFEDEVVSGEMRVQITYEQYKVHIDAIIFFLTSPDCLLDETGTYPARFRISQAYWSRHLWQGFSGTEKGH